MQSVAIIGGGLSGSMLALELLRAGDAHVTLVDRMGAFGRGVAYSTGDDAHLLNVPAARMSVFGDDPDHFVRWLERRRGVVSPAAYLPRGLYGTYVREQLALAASARSGGGHGLELLPAQVVDVEPVDGGGLVRFADGTSATFDAVVLATGSPPGSPPLPLPDDPRVYADAWTEGALRPYPPGHHTLVVGSGLTAIDVALATTRLGASVTAVSRHGLLPEQHLPGLRVPLSPAALPQGELSLDEMERFVTDHIRGARTAGGDWRDAFDGLRPHVPQLWGTLTPQARREFLKSRVRLWDVCRHRMPPASAQRIAALRENGQLQVIAGALGTVTATDDAVEVEVDGRLLRVDRFVCCTGASRDVRTDPLVARLVQRGLASRDELSLGLRADALGALYDESGESQRWLRTLGPLRRGELWETTAAEEIRAQAGTVARAILSDSRARAAIAAS